MKHNIGPSQYSTFHSYAQSHAIPFNYGSLAGTIATAHNLQMGLNERKEEARKAEAAQSKREIAEAKQMAYQAEQDWDKMEQSQYMVSDPGPQNIGYQQAMDITGNAAGVNRFSGHRTYPGYEMSSAPTFQQTDPAMDPPMRVAPAPGTYTNPNMTSPFEARFGPFGNWQ